MTGITNKGKAHILHAAFRRTSLPSNYYVALVTDATAPDADTNTFAELTEITTDANYTSGGYSLTPGTTDFDVLTEDDTNSRGLVQIKDVSWGGSLTVIPSGSGVTVRYAVLLDDNATVADREVYAYWDLKSDQLAFHQAFTLEDLELRFSGSASGVTNKGRAHILHAAFRRTSLPTKYYVALVTSATAPGATTNTLSDLTEIAAGNGYTSGGYSLTPGTTDFDANTEDDSSDYGSVQIKDVVWTASGSIPASGSGARYAVLLDDNATVADREVYAYWDLVSDRTATDDTFTLVDLEIKLTES